MCSNCATDAVCACEGGSGLETCACEKGRPCPACKHEAAEVVSGSTTRIVETEEMIEAEESFETVE